MMTKQQRARLELYLEHCQRILHLCDWAVAIMDEPPAEGAIADIEVTEFCNARLRLAAGFFTHPPEWQRRIVAHELMHLHTARIRACPDLLENAMSQVPFTIFVFHVEAIEDELVERVTRLVEGLLPLPKLGGSK